MEVNDLEGLIDHVSQAVVRVVDREGAAFHLTHVKQVDKQPFHHLRRETELLQVAVSLFDAGTASLDVAQEVSLLALQLGDFCTERDQLIAHKV